MQADGPPARSRTRVRAVMARDRPRRRPDRQEGDVRLQPHRRDRRDAPPARPGAGRSAAPASWSASPVRPRRDARACAATPPCRSTPTATAGARSPRHPSLGFDYVAWAKLWRLAGADHMHVNGLRNKFCEPDDSVIASARACLTPMFAAQALHRHAGLLLRPVGARRSGTPTPRSARADLIYAAGGGIMGHPGGPAAGVAALRDAWDAALAGEPAADARRPLAGARRRAGEVRMTAAAPARSTARSSPGTATTSPAPAAVMEVLTFAGLPAVLFLDPPTPERARPLPRRPRRRPRRRRPHPQPRLDATPSCPPSSPASRALGAPILHYKVCSTLDSAPHVGSIGARRRDRPRARRDRAAPRRRARPSAAGRPSAPCSPAPATASTGSTATRPCRVHPVTPMDEADVRRHLARQTTLGLGLDRPRRPEGRPRRRRASPRSAPRGAGIVALDVVDDETLAAAGALIWQARPAASSSARRASSTRSSPHGAPRACCRRPRSRSPSPRSTGSPSSPAPARRSPPTQIDARRSRRLRGDPPRPAAPRDWTAAADAAARRARRAAARPSSPPPAAPPIPACADADARIGAGLGRLLDRLVREAGLTRAVIAGGDTSSHAARALGLVALTAETPVAPGAALLPRPPRRRHARSRSRSRAARWVRPTSSSASGTARNRRRSSRRMRRNGMTKIALMGAGGKMGVRLATNLHGHPLRHRPRRGRRGRPRPPQGRHRPRLHRAGPGALAAPTSCSSPCRTAPSAWSPTRSSRSSTPAPPSSSSTPPRPHAGEMPERADVTYFVTHPCHPPLFNDETDPAAKADYFGGIARQAAHRLRADAGPRGALRPLRGGRPRRSTSR